MAYIPNYGTVELDERKAFESLLEASTVATSSTFIKDRIVLISL
jgi:hypothetical protein